MIDSPSIARFVALCYADRPVGSAPLMKSHWCHLGAVAQAASRVGLEAGWLSDSVKSLAACRAFFALSEREYAKVGVG